MDDSMYVYADGKTLVQLGIQGESDINKFPKYNISSETSTIAFTKFLDVANM